MAWIAHIENLSRREQHFFNTGGGPIAEWGYLAYPHEPGLFPDAWIKCKHGASISFMLTRPTLNSMFRMMLEQDKEK